MLPKVNYLLPELRFKGFNDEWRKFRLDELICKNTERNKNMQFSNVESISNKYGFIKQNDYFENNKIASNDTSAYYVIRKDAFAYNPSRIDVGSIALKNNDEVSIISPLYVSFYPRNIDKYFLWYFMHTNLFEQQRIINTTKGVRSSLSFDTLKEMYILAPSKKEQEKISAFFVRIDKLIKLQESKVDLLKAKKQYFLQNLFA